MILLVPSYFKYKHQATSIKHQENGLLVNFFDTDKLAETIEQVLKDPDKYKQLGKEARKTIKQKYDLNRACLPRLLELTNKIVREANARHQN